MGKATDIRVTTSAPAIPVFRHGLLQAPGNWIAVALGFSDWKSFLRHAEPGYSYATVIPAEWAHMAKSPCLLDICRCDDVAIRKTELHDGSVSVEISISDQQPELPIFQA